MKEVLLLGHEACNPCKVAYAWLEKNLPERFRYIDCQKKPQTAVRFNVQSAPTIVLVDGPKVLKRWEGWSNAIGQEILNELSG